MLYANRPILSRLSSRFKLLENGLSIPNPVVMASQIIPVTSIDELLTDLKIVTDTIAVTSTGSKNSSVTVVPAGKRWRLRSFQATLASGTFTMSAIILQDYGGVYCYVYSVTPSVTVILIGPNYWNQQRLDQQWTISVLVDTKAVNGTVEIRMAYEEEDAY